MFMDQNDSSGLQKDAALPIWYCHSKLIGDRVRIDVSKIMWMQTLVLIFAIYH